MKRAIQIESHYLPSIEFFSAIIPFDEIILEVNENFQKQSFRNRCYINTAQGMRMLTVPVVNGHGKVLMKDILLEPGNAWRNVHWRTIESAYRKAPFFDYYYDDLRKIIYENHSHLLEFNRELLSFCLRQISFEKNISATLTYDEAVSENIFDCRSVISCKKPFTDRNFYKPKKYQQVFGNDFVPNLSFIDLLFCEGPRSSEFLLSV